MTRTPRRRLAAGAVAGLLALLLAGCGDEPVRAGSAAVVGDERITTEELAAIVERGLEDPQAKEQFGADEADYQRQVLSRMVRGLLLERAAEDAGVEVTQGDVDATLAEFVQQVGSREELEKQAAAGGIASQDLPRFAREIALEQALGDELTADVEVPQTDLQALYDQNAGQFQRVRSRHILVAAEAQARDLLAQVQADPSRFAALAAQFSTDTSNKDDGGDLGLQPRGTFVGPFDEAVFSRPLEEPFVVQTEFGWHVVVVDEREVRTLQDASDDLRRQALQDQRGAAVQEALAATADEVGVEVNPRFGTWDSLSGQVQPTSGDDGLSSPEPAPGDGGAVGPGDGGVPPGGTGTAPEEPAGTPSS